MSAATPQNLVQAIPRPPRALSAAEEVERKVLRARLLAQPTSGAPRQRFPRQLPSQRSVAIRSDLKEAMMPEWWETIPQQAAAALIRTTWQCVRPCETGQPAVLVREAAVQGAVFRLRAHKLQHRALRFLVQFALTRIATSSAAVGRLLHPEALQALQGSSPDAQPAAGATPRSHPNHPEPSANHGDLGSARNPSSPTH